MGELWRQTAQVHILAVPLDGRGIRLSFLDLSFLFVKCVSSYLPQGAVMKIK